MLYKDRLCHLDASSLLCKNYNLYNQPIVGKFPIQVTSANSFRSLYWTCTAEVGAAAVVFLLRLNSTMSFGQAFPLAVPTQTQKPSFGPDLSVRLICPECRDPNPNIVEEFGSGDLVCGGCGLVLGDRVVDTRSECKARCSRISIRVH